MKTVFRGAALLAASALILSGCNGVEAVEGPPANTAECKSRWQAESRAAGQGVIATGNLGAAIITGLFSAAVISERKAAVDARLSACLARFGVTDMEAFLAEGDAPVIGSAAAVASPAPLRSGFDRPASATANYPVSGFCEQGAGVLQGGAGYCVGSTN